MASLQSINGPAIARPTVGSVRLFNDQDANALGSLPAVETPDPVAFHNAPKAMQEGYVGSSFQTAFQEASRFLNYMISHLPAGEFPERVLDFGCGWGRMLRLLRRHEQLKGVEMFGVDISLPALDVVRRTLPGVWLSPVDIFPPSMLRDSSIDVIYAYSVFSHISEPSHVAWAKEFARLMRPGGTVCLTTQGMKCIRMCQDLRSGRQPVNTPWLERLAASFDDPKVDEKYAGGQFLYSAQGGHGDPNVYGQAAVPPKYFERVWGDLGFTMVDWNDDELQSRTVMRFRA